MMPKFFLFCEQNLRLSAHLPRSTELPGPPDILGVSLSFVNTKGTTAKLANSRQPFCPPHTDERV